MLDGWVGDGWVGRVRGKKTQFRGYLGEALGTHESSEERVEPQESFTTFVVRSKTQERVLSLFATFSTFSEILTDYTPKLQIIPVIADYTLKQVSPKKKRRTYGYKGIGYNFPHFPSAS